MAKPSVYLETSIIGYATSRPSKELLVAARQQLTREWFADAAEGYELFVSRLVIDEAGRGDAEAAAARLAFVQDMTTLTTPVAVDELAQRIVDANAMPEVAKPDAYHVAAAAINGVDYLLTWNCRHIANASLRKAIETVCRDAGYEPPIICTPEELSNDPRRR